MAPLRMTASSSLEESCRSVMVHEPTSTVSTSSAVQSEMVACSSSWKRWCSSSSSHSTTPRPSAGASVVVLSPSSKRYDASGGPETPERPRPSKRSEAGPALERRAANEKEAHAARARCSAKSSWISFAKPGSDFQQTRSLQPHCVPSEETRVGLFRGTTVSHPAQTRPSAWSRVKASCAANAGQSCACSAAATSHIASSTAKLPSTRKNAWSAPRAASWNCLDSS
mmetsp:Transcript_12249/g.40843  ORF Transcript_12249/g.40843 Transcript_12249/m.40843 type:complete len:226 (-) Transcript_12249:2003-2680(-)